MENEKYYMAVNAGDRYPLLKILTVMMQLTNLKHWHEEVIFPFLLMSLRRHMITMVILFGIANVV